MRDGKWAESSGGWLAGRAAWTTCLTAEFTLMHLQLLEVEVGCKVPRYMEHSYNYPYLIGYPHVD